MIEVEGGDDYARIIGALQGFNKDLEKNLSKRISAAARPVVAEMRNEVRGVKSGINGKSGGRGGGGARRRADFATRNDITNLATAVSTGRRVLSDQKRSEKRERARGLRESVARGVRLSNVKKGRNSGIVIRSSGTYLPPDQKKLPRAMNRGKWRHPVFGDRSVWVEQTATPVGWFDNTGKKAQPGLVREITKAVDESVRELPSKVRRSL